MCYTWHHIHTIPDITPTVYDNTHSNFDITATVTMTRHLLCFWHYTQCIRHLTLWKNDNTANVSDVIPMYLCNHTHLIDDITRYVCTKSHPMNVWHRRHFIWHHIHSCWQHTIVCHGTHVVYDIICIICDVTHTLCMTTQALYLTCNPLKMPSHPLCMPSHPLSRRHHTYCVRHHRWHMYAIICVIHDIISTLYDKSPYYVWHHMHSMHYITCIIYDISSTLCDVTFTMCVTSHNDYWSMASNNRVMTYSFIWHHTQCYDHTTLVCLHSHYAWHYSVF